MITTFHKKKITGMLAVMPENEYDYDEETKKIATLQSRRLKRVMGFGKRRVVKKTTATSDMLHYAMKYLLDKELINVQDVGAIIVVGLTPDYFIPHNSNILHGQFGFDKDVVCVDIPQGCCGFMLGMMEASMLLEHMQDKKAIIFTCDVLNRKDVTDDIEAPSFGGDACSVTVMEHDENATDIYFSSYTDGANRDALIMHAGGWKLPRSEETSIPVDMGYGDGSMKPKDALWMNGSKVFNFVQKEVPPMIEEMYEYSGISKEMIDIYFFHQPNQFMLHKLAERMSVPYEKMPSNIVGKYGNSSGSTIPVTITDNYGERLEKEQVKCCLSGFGAGLAWSCAIMDLGYLDFCRLVISDL